MEIYEREISCYGYYIPQTKESIRMILEKALKKYVVQFYQLKVEHKVVGNYFAEIEVIETPWWYGQAEQSVEYLYTKYCQ